MNTEMCMFESSQKEKAEPIRLIPRKLAANAELLIVFYNINAIFKFYGGARHVCLLYFVRFFILLVHKNYALPSTSSFSFSITTNFFSLAVSLIMLLSVRKHVVVLH